MDNAAVAEAMAVVAAARIATLNALQRLGHG